MSDILSSIDRGFRFGCIYRESDSKDEICNETLSKFHAENEPWIRQNGWCVLARVKMLDTILRNFLSDLSFFFFYFGMNFSVLIFNAMKMKIKRSEVGAEVYKFQARYIYTNFSHCASKFSSL